MIRKLEGGQTDWGQFPRDLATAWHVQAIPEDTWFEVRYESAERESVFAGITQIVIEDFVLYPPGVGDGPPPWWDELITPRVIGRIHGYADLAGIPVDYQGASIKSDALASAAAEDFARPLYENRHENDATMHGTYYFSRLLGAGKLEPGIRLLAIDPGETIGWAVFES